ncbi:MAG: hypothetical protein NTV79_09920, partial [Candidatus Aureabacteria bacterium]|nr:hypothetical protein [Candidatus Auribacterota bacterium]
GTGPTTTEYNNDVGCRPGALTRRENARSGTGPTTGSYKHDRMSMPGNHRVPSSIRTIARDIADIALGRTFILMEVCGTHTVSSSAPGSARSFPPPSASSPGRAVRCASLPSPTSTA